MISEDRHLASKTACKWSPNTGKESNFLPMDCPGVSYIVWSNSFGRAVNDAFKKKQNRRFPDKFGSVPVSLQVSRTHKTLYCFPWQFSSCPPQSVPIFLRSFNSSQAPESKTCLFNNRGTLRWLHCWFYLKCEHVGDVMCRNT